MKNYLKFKFYSEMLLESANITNIVNGESNVYSNLNNIEETQYLLNSENNTTNKPNGFYITIQANNDFLEREKDEIILTKRINKALDRIIRHGKYKKDKILIVGLGNKDITADSLGIKTVECINAENNNICKLLPSVKGVSGIDSYEVIKGVTDRIKPTLIIAVDTLASRAVYRLARSFQLTNTGIEAGSGVNNTQKYLNKESLGVNVISIGVPLVMYARYIVENILKEMNIKIDNRDINNQVENLIIAPSNIDMLVNKLGKIIGNSINNLF